MLLLYFSDHPSIPCHQLNSGVLIIIGSLLEKYLSTSLMCFVLYSVLTAMCLFDLSRDCSHLSPPMVFNLTVIVCIYLRGVYLSRLFVIPTRFVDVVRQSRAPLKWIEDCAEHKLEFRSVSFGYLLCYVQVVWKPCGQRITLAHWELRIVRSK